MTTAERTANRATAAANIVRQNANQYLVPSATTVGLIYPVRRIHGDWMCCCDAAVNGRGCWHRSAVRQIDAAERQAQRDSDPAMIAARAHALNLLTDKA